VDPLHRPGGQLSRQLGRPRQTVPTMPRAMTARPFPIRRPRSLIRMPPSCRPWVRNPRCRRPASRSHRLLGLPSPTPASRFHRHPAKPVAGLRRRLVALQVDGPVRHRWAGVLLWVVVPASQCPVRVPDGLAGPVVVLEADPVAQEVDPVVQEVVLEGVAHRVVRGGVVVVVKNFNRWTCRPTRLRTRRCPRAR